MFTEAEKLRLVELFEERKGVLECAGKGAAQNAAKKKAWNEISEILNGEFPEKHFDVDQVIEKWRNLKKKAKSLSASLAKSRRKTGGRLFQFFLEKVVFVCFRGQSGTRKCFAVHFQSVGHVRGVTRFSRGAEL